MGEYINVTEMFGCDVFNDSVMQERLPKKVYRDLKKTIEEGKELSMEMADVIAHEMKEWAIEKALPITATGSSPSPASPRKSMTPLSQHPWKTERC